MKKAKHKYPIGTEVKFKYFDGSIHVGVVIKQTYQGDSWDHLETDYKQTLYTMQVPDMHDSRGFMLYPSVGPHRIIESNGITNKEYAFTKKNVLSGSTRKKSKAITNKFNDTTSELDAAISKQQDFINGKNKR